MFIRSVLSHLGGAARREQLLARGVGRWEVTAALRAGLVERHHRGVYSLPGTTRPIILARAFRASVACVTACEAFGLPLLERPTQVHLAVDTGRSIARPGLRPVEEVHVHASVQFRKGALRVAPWVAVDQAGECLGPLAQLVALDAALARGLMRLGDLDRFTVTPLLRRRWLAAHCDSRAESLLETVARVRLRAAGFGVEPQVKIPGVGRVDLLVEGRIVVELDGREFHDTAAAFATDRRRDRVLQTLGYRVARFTYQEVIDTPHVLETSVRQMLDAPVTPRPAVRTVEGASAAYQRPAVRTVDGAGEARATGSGLRPASGVASVPPTVRTAGVDVRRARGQPPWFDAGARIA